MTTEPTPPAPKRFLRSSTERVLGGVGGGLGTYFGVDPWIPRLALLGTSIFGGAGLLAYLAALVLVPAEDPAHPGSPSPERRAPGTITALIGVALLGLAIVSVFDGWWFGGAIIPLAVIAAVAFAASRTLRGDVAPTAARVTGYVLLGIAGVCGAGAAFVGSAWASAIGGGEIVAGFVIALGVIAAGSAFLRPARWLAIPALIVAVPLSVVAAADIDAEGEIGEVYYAPDGPPIPSEGFEMAAGYLEVDLRAMRWPESGVVRVPVEMGMGHVRVLVPHEVCVSARTSTGMGYLGIGRRDSGGIDVTHDVGAPVGTPRLELEARVGIGAIEVVEDSGGRWRDRDGVRICGEAR